MNSIHSHLFFCVQGNERVLDFGLSFNADAVSINIRTWLFVGTFFAEHLQHVWSVLTMVVVNFWHIYRSVHLLRYNSVPAFLGLAAVFALKMPFNVVDRFEFSFYNWWKKLVCKLLEDG